MAVLYHTRVNTSMGRVAKASTIITSLALIGMLNFSFINYGTAVLFIIVAQLFKDGEILESRDISRHCSAGSYFSKQPAHNLT